MKKVISFSLWGDNPKYCIGAIRNAEDAKKFYPGWETWFFCGKSVPSNVIELLKNEGSRVIMREEKEDWTSTFWRFEPISHPDVEIMISRDTDSRLSSRESSAVNVWLESGKLFHVMRDHPAHATEILAGMWGARKPILGDIMYLMKAYMKIDTKQADQNFLREVVWPRVIYETMTHDEFFAKTAFPSKRTGLEFVGQVYDENNVPCLEFENTLASYLSTK